MNKNTIDALGILARAQGQFDAECGERVVGLSRKQSREQRVFAGKLLIHATAYVRNAQ